jgi:type II secretory pathway component PulF
MVGHEWRQTVVMTDGRKLAKAEERRRGHRVLLLRRQLAALYKANSRLRKALRAEGIEPGV